MTKYKIFYNQNAGSAVLSQFNIFTTGIVNWANFYQEDQNLIQIWNKELKKFIFSKISPNFTEINIYHYDPIYDAGTRSRLAISKIKESIEYVNSNLIPNDFGTERVNLSEFFDRPLDIARIQALRNPYIILDFAHVFDYIPLKNHVVIGNNYSEDSDQRPLKLNVLRTGYIGNGFGRLFSTTNTFTINPDGSLYTYIDKMIDLGIEYDYKNPEYYFETILKKTIQRIEQTVKDLKGGTPIYKIEHIINDVLPEQMNLVNLIVDKFMNGTYSDSETIIVELTQEVISLKLEFILQTPIRE
jgi:hypothetical protein